MSRDIITAPGIYDLDEDWYHQDFGPVPEGSLSVSGAKLLLPPGCPAIYDYRRRHRKPPSGEMELGTVVHGMILRTGQPVEVIDAADWRTKAAKEARAAALEAGSVPMLPHQHAEARAIADAVLADPDAGGLLAEGDAEQSLFWIDPKWDIWLRGRTDWLTYFDGQPVIVDIKTAASASPEKFAKSVDDYRYYMQDPHYREGIAAILGCEPGDVDFVFVAVPTEPPYLVMTYRLTAEDVALGREANAIAREKYRDCTDSGTWPKWSDDITELALPGYARRRIEGEINDWHR